MQRTRSLHPLYSAALVALGLSVVACGGNGKPAEHPKVDSSGHPTGAGSNVTAGAGGPQVAADDAPSSGDSGANRPKMSAAAAAAYDAGIAAFASGDLDTAKAQFLKAGEADGNAYQAHYSLGVVLERLGDATGALNAYRRATTVVADYEPALVAYAGLLARTHRIGEAESFLEGQQAKFPKSAALTAGLAEVKSIKGETAEAQRLAQEALKKNPDYRPAMITIARDHYRARRLDLALYALAGILEGYGPENPPRDKNSAEALLLRALIQRERGQRQGALADFGRALELRPDLVEAAVALAAFNLESGDAAAAAALLERALKYDRAHVSARLNLGDAYRLLGRSADALRELQWVVAKDASLAQVHYNLGLLYLFGQDLPGLSPKQAAEKAVEELELYKKMRPRTLGPDDTDELINRARAKISVIEAQAAEAAEAAKAPKAADAPKEAEAPKAADAPKEAEAPPAQQEGQ